MDFSSWPTLLVADIEGNGNNPPDLVEIAAYPVRDGQADKTTAGAWLTKPNRPVTPFAARVHGLTNQVLEDKPSWEEIRDEVHTMLGTAWIAAHNAHVDYRVLSAHLPQVAPGRSHRHAPAGQGHLPRSPQVHPGRPDRARSPGPA